MANRRYTEVELNEIHHKELELLKTFKEICEELNLEYFADGGTAIGAVRHKGFIPWDDDVDIGMTRLNYSKFLEKAPFLLPNYISLQSPYNDKNCPYYYAKLRYNGTKFVEYCNHSVNTHHGIYIDIFPFDEVPDNERLNIRQFKKFQKWIRIFTLHQFPDVSVPPKSFNSRVRAVLRRFAYYLARLIPYQYIVKKLDNIATMYNGTGQSAYSGLTAPKRNWDYVKKEGYKPFILMDFEGISINMLHDYDANLRSLYNNYMELPPEEDRNSHYPYVLDIGIK